MNKQKKKLCLPDSEGQCTTAQWTAKLQYVISIFSVLISFCLFPFAAENIPARFGNDNWPSYAVFTVDDNPGPDSIISMFIGTTEHAGLLLVIANSTNQYLRIWLDGGFIQVQANDFEMLHGEQFVSDGNFHLVTVETEEDRMSLFQSGQKHGVTTTIQTLQIRPKDKVHLGSLVDQPASSLFGGYFKGCIQDLRVNSKHLQFYPVGTPISSYTLDTIVNVTRGCTSDTICNVRHYEHDLSYVF